MPSSKLTHDVHSAAPILGVKEEQVEYSFIAKARARAGAGAQAETALMTDLIPLLTKRVQGREISGLTAYE